MLAGSPHTGVNEQDWHDSDELLKSGMNKREEQSTS